MIALVSLLPDDHRVPEPHTSYTDTGGKIILQDSIYSEENMFFFLLHSKRKKGKSPVGKETINTKSDTAVLVPPSPETYLHKHTLRKYSSGAAILGDMIPLHSLIY